MDWWIHETEMKENDGIHWLRKEGACDETEQT